MSKKHNNVWESSRYLKFGRSDMRRKLIRPPATPVPVLEAKHAHAGPRAGTARKRGRALQGPGEERGRHVLRDAG